MEGPSASFGGMIGMTYTAMRRIAMAAAVIIAAVICCCLPAERAMCEPRAESVALGDFKEIPGITPEEISSIESLRSKYDRFTVGTLMSTETFERDDGSVGGYSALFCDWMSELFGIRFEPSIYDWNTLITRFERGEIDFTGELTSTPERLGRYIMTDTFTERAIKAFRVRGSESLSEIAKTRPLRYAFLAGSTTTDAVVAASAFDIDVCLVATEDEAAERLRHGVIDAFMGEEHSAAAFGDDIYGEDVFPVVYSPISFSTARSELEPIVRVFDKYIKAGVSGNLAYLYSLGHDEYLRHRLNNRLTAEEKAYIAAHGTSGAPIPILAEFDAYPASFYNQPDGEWQGIAHDVLAAVGELTGLSFKVVNEEGEPWASLLYKLEAGEGLLVTELIYSSERKDRFLWADEPYSVDYYALVSLGSYPDIGIKEVRNSRVGLILDSAYMDVFHEWFPDHTNTHEYASASDGFAALERGEIDLLMASRNLLLSVTNYHEQPGFKANIVFNRTYESSFGFYREAQLLRSIVSKAQSLVDTDAIADRWTRKVFDYRGKLARAQVPYLMGLTGALVGLLLLVVVFLIRNAQMKRKLERTVHERTAELEVQTENARIASQAKGDFLSRMSHEIRTPLNAIIGMAHIARNAVPVSPEKTASSIEEIIAASSHLMGILNDVLDMSKIEAGKFTLASEPFSMLSAMHDVENIIIQRCAEKGVSFITNLGEVGDFAVMGDNLRLRQVLINLLGNAVKFTEECGRVELLLKKVEEGDGYVTIRYVVRDDGIGMNEEQLGRLFTAFEQADGSIASKFGGTGLGLAISQNLVEQMGGKIVVESQPGVGSAFSFEVSFAKAEPGDLPLGSVHAADGATVLDLSGRRLLLVEDIAINRLIVTELLSETGVEIEEAENGEEAASMFERSPVGHYDLIFMDIQMPVMDGYEATRTIRGLDRPDAATVPIIAMTANAYREDIERALDVGMNGHLSKPIDIEDVKRLLAERIEGR